jgi:hypothetical protein
MNKSKVKAVPQPKVVLAGTPHAEVPGSEDVDAMVARAFVLRADAKEQYIQIALKDWDKCHTKEDVVRWIARHKTIAGYNGLCRALLAKYNLK